MWGNQSNHWKWVYSVFVSLLLAIPSAASARDIVIRPGQPVRIATMDAPDSGVIMRDGVDLAVEQFGGTLLGHRIETKHYGRGCNFTNPVSFLNGMLSEPKTIGSIGPICSGAAARIVEILSAAQTVNISPANTASGFADPDFHALIPYYFRTSPNTLIQGTLAGNFAAAPINPGLGAKTAAIIYYPNEEYSSELVQTFSDAFKAGGGAEPELHEIQFGQTDFQADVAALGEIDVVYAPIFFDEFIPFYLELRKRFPNVPLIGPDSVAFPLSEIFGSDPVEIYVTNVTENGPEYDAYAENFEARYGEKPALYNGLAYDGTLLLLNAAAAVASVDQKGNLTISTEAMLDYLNDSANYPYAGAGATYQTPVRGDLNPSGWEVLQESGGELHHIFP